MYLFVSPSREPAFNLGLEEVILKSHHMEAVILYQNKPSVICGKHQNLMAEINPQYCHRHSIPLYRRLSGGGTVYHDEGNINFSFILTKDEGKQVDFQMHVEPIIRFLKTLGLDARFGGHNDIRIGEWKISGNAEHVYKTKVLHHGTLLFDANLESLKASLRKTNANYQGRWVKSVPANVANLKPLLDPEMDISDFIGSLLQYLGTSLNIDGFEAISETLFAQAESLAKSKYSTQEWVFGYSPKYEFSNSNDDHVLNLSVEGGRIMDASLHNRNNSSEEPQSMNYLKGKWHAPPLLDELSEGDFALGHEELRNLLF